MLVVVIPSGRRVPLDAYVRAWRALRTADPAEEVAGWSDWPVPVERVLVDLRAGLHDRINQHAPRYGRGRKWSNDWQRALIQTAYRANTPRLVLDWVPIEFRERLNHRMRDREGS